MADKKDKRKQESYVRAPYEKAKSEKNKTLAVIKNALLLGRAEDEYRIKKAKGSGGLSGLKIANDEKAYPFLQQAQRAFGAMVGVDAGTKPKPKKKK